MTISRLTDHDLILYVFSAGAWLTAGIIIGAAHFRTLRWNVRMFAVGQSLPLALAIQLFRFALIGGALGFIATSFGAMPLLAATGGILATRTVIVRLGAPP